jgi:hypothetical protein
MGVLEELMAQFAPPEDPRVAAIDRLMGQTRLQQDLGRRMRQGEMLSGKDAMNFANSSHPPEYKGLPEDPDDIFGY